MRVGDHVIIRATVLDVLDGGTVKVHTLHPRESVQQVIEMLRPGDPVRLANGRTGRVIAIEGRQAWIRWDEFYQNPSVDQIVGITDLDRIKG